MRRAERLQGEQTAEARANPRAGRARRLGPSRFFSLETGDGDGPLDVPLEHQEDDEQGDDGDRGRGHHEGPVAVVLGLQVRGGEGERLPGARW